MRGRTAGCYSRPPPEGPGNFHAAQLKGAAAHPPSAQACRCDALAPSPIGSIATLIRPPASLPLSAHAHRWFQAPPHESAPRPQHHARAGGHLREARRIWVRAACAYAWPRHTTHDQPRAAHVYIRAGPPRTGKDRTKKARAAQKGKDRPIGLARRAASQAALLGWGLRGKPPYREKWVWRTQLWLKGKTHVFGQARGVGDKTFLFRE